VTVDAVSGTLIGYNGREVHHLHPSRDSPSQRGNDHLRGEDIPRAGRMNRHRGIALAPRAATCFRG